MKGTIIIMVRTLGTDCLYAL